MVSGVVSVRCGDSPLVRLAKAEPPLYAPSDNTPHPEFKGGQWQVLHDLVEQLVQLEEAALIRLEPPPMPKDEIIFCGS
jgi:hypothetical protein